MDMRKAKDFLNSHLFKVKGKYLSSVEITLFEGMWANARYNQMAESSGYAASYLSRDAALKFRKLIKEIFNVSSPVKKGDFREFIIRQAKDESLPSSSPPIDLRRNRISDLAEAIQLRKYRLLFVYSPRNTAKDSFIRHLKDSIQDTFTVTHQLSLSNYSTPTQCLTEIISYFQQEAPQEEQSFNQLLQRVRQVFKHQTCLLILKDAEFVYQRATLASQYALGFEEYGTFLNQIAQDVTDSCVIWVGCHPPVRDVHTFQRYICFERLNGLSSQEIQELNPIARTLQGSAHQWQAFQECFDGNLYLLKEAIQDVINGHQGDLAQYLQSPLKLSKRMRDYFQDLIHGWVSPEELTILQWLALGQTTVQTLEASIRRLAQGSHLLDILDSLEARSLCQKTERGVYFLSESIAVYMLDKLLTQLTTELLKGELQVLHDIALQQSPHPDECFLNKYRSRVLISLVERLEDSWPTLKDRISGLEKCLQHLQQSRKISQSYAAGNLLKIAVAFNLELQRFKFSQTHLRCVDFRRTDLHNVDFTRCEFRECTFPHPIEERNILAFSSNNAWLATGDSDGRIFIWDLKQCQLHKIYHNHDHSPRDRVGVQALGFHQDNILLAVGDDGLVRYWNINSPMTLPFDYQEGFPKVETTSIKFISFNSDCNRAVLVTETGEIKVLNTTSKQDPLSFQPDHEYQEITAVEFSPDNQFLVSCDRSTLHLWQIVEWPPTHAGIWRAEGIIVSINVQRGLRHDINIFVAEKQDNTIQVYQLLVTREHRIQSRMSWQCPLPEGVEASDLSFSPDAQYLASINSDQTIRLWYCLDATTISEQQPISLKPIPLKIVPVNTTSSLALARGGHTLAAVSSGQLQIWDRTHQSNQLKRGYWHRMSCFAITTQARVVVIGYEDGTLRLWNGQTGRYIHRLAVHSARIQQLAFSPCGNRLAVSDAQGQLCIFNMQTNELEDWSRDVYQQHIRCLQFSPDSRWLASISSDSGITIWPIDQCVNNICPEQTISAQVTRSITCLSFIPNSNQWQLIYGGAYGELFRWDHATQREELLKDDIGIIEQLQVGTDGTAALIRLRNSIYLLDLTNSSGDFIKIPVDVNADILAAGFDKTGQVIVAYSIDPTQRQITYWSRSTNNSTNVQFPRSVKSATFTTDGQYLIGYQTSKRLFVCHLGSNKIKVINAYYPYTGLNISGCLGLKPQDQLLIMETERGIES